MAAIPGSVGWPVFGDQSMDFNSDAVGFVNSQMKQYKSRVFAGRLLNRATVYICSNRGVQQILADKTGAFGLGYKALMEQVYNDNILFYDDEEACILRDKIAPLFCPEAFRSYQDTVNSIVDFHIASINPRRPLPVYQFFKKVVTEITLTVFLGLDFIKHPAEASRVVKQTLNHWKGLISVPVKVKLPGIPYKSCFCKSEIAKKELLKVIQNQRGKAPNTFIRRLQQMAASEEDDDFINNHLLLFSCAIVPKAVGSMLTTMAIEMGRPHMVSKQAELAKNPEMMRNVMREVQRICPPFVGGRRLARKDVVVDGYKVPEGYGVVFMTQAAHRDPKVFSDPDLFQPDRWKDTTKLSDANLFVFGQGHRDCVGQQLMQYIMDTLARQLASQYSWELPEQQDLSMKFMPVARPKSPILVHLIPRNPAPTTPTPFSHMPSTLTSSEDSLKSSSSSREDAGPSFM